MAEGRTPERVRELLNSFFKKPYQRVDQTNRADDGKCNEDLPDEPKRPVSNPKDKSAYFDRVKTYSSLTWFAKPSWLTALQCARYGWENVAVDSLRCVTCQAHISGRLPKPSLPQAYSECKTQVENAIRNGHNAMCPWSNSPCPENFMQIPVREPREATEGFCLRGTTLKQLEDKLPKLNPDFLSQESVTADSMRKLRQVASGGYTDEGVMDTAVILALCGWKSLKQHSCDLITCSYCSREAGVWNFIAINDPDDLDTSQTVTDNETSFTMLQKGTVPSEKSQPETVSEQESTSETEPLDLSDKTSKTPETNDTAESQGSPKTTATEHDGDNDESNKQKEKSSEHQNGSSSSNKGATETLYYRSESWTDDYENNRPDANGHDTGAEPNPKADTTEKSKYNRKRDNTDKQVNEEVPRKRTKIKKSTFHPVTEHRTWCPWATGHPETATSDYDELPGWKKLLYVLVPDASPKKDITIQELVKTTPPHESLRSIRRLFNDWESPCVSLAAK